MKVLRYTLFTLMIALVFNCGGEKEKKEEKEQIKIGSKKEKVEETNNHPSKGEDVNFDDDLPPNPPRFAEGEAPSPSKKDDLPF